MFDPAPHLLLYPSLESKFNSLAPSIRGKLTFDTIKNQLTWAFNEYEQKRAIHRLHCLITSLLSGNNPHFEMLSAHQKEALIVLTILDGCKNSKESIDAYLAKGFVALKDGVPSLFDMLKNAPQLFPAHEELSKEAKDVIKTEFFYLHLRHLQLGEVPVASVRKDVLTRPRNLMIAFWHANAMGFDIEKPYPLGEATGPTITPEQNDRFEKLLEAIETNKLLDYYSKGSIFEGRPNLRGSFSEGAIELICRLGKMLSFIKLSQNDNDFLVFVAKNTAQIEQLASQEFSTYSDHAIEAFTFLPAVLKTLREKIMPESPLGEVLGVFLALQRQLYQSAPGFLDVLGNNRTIPLFGLSDSQGAMLTQFANSSNKENFHFEASVDKFINIKLVDGPVLDARSKKQVYPAVN